MCRGKVSVPGPTQQEQELQSLQLAELKKYQQMSAAMEPLLLANMGYKTVTNPDGTIGLVAMTEEERKAVLPESVLQDETLYRNYQDYALKALKGELPVSPALEDEIALNQKKLEETLSQKLGPNWRMTTPGIQAQKAFDQAASLAREEARRGQIAQGAQLVSSGLPQASDVNLFTNTSGITQPSLGLLSTTPGILQGYQNERAMGLRANLANAQNRTQMVTAALGLLGQAGGTAGGLAALKYLK